MNHNRDELSGHRWLLDLYKTQGPLGRRRSSTVICRRANPRAAADGERGRAVAAAREPNDPHPQAHPSARKRPAPAVPGPTAGSAKPASPLAGSDVPLPGPAPRDARQPSPGKAAGCQAPAPRRFDKPPPPARPGPYSASGAGAPRTSPLLSSAERGR